MRRLRQHVNPLKAEYLESRRLRVEAPPGRELEVELGCADAQFLFQRAAADPQCWAVGLEIRRELCDAVNRRAEEQGADVRAIYSHINVDLPGMFVSGAVARIFVNFPDPWFKRRHHKRRVLDETIAAACADALRPGGELFFQSDVWGPSLEALAVLEAEPRLSNCAGPWSFWREGNPYRVTSRREEACAEEGLAVWRMLYRRV
jgi:tRNA (guanine-N7-)-methyltransferase